ncbi:DMT family transporter [Candidatus Gracilibacteria bacterium]|nr:DMT family transporter [Candidatus Gracilibacteria bacterium]
MIIFEERKGEIFIFFEALLWSLFPIVTILSLNTLSPITSLAWSTFFASIFFGITLYLKGNFREIKNKESLKDNLIGTFILGILYYCLFFFGLRYTTAGNASIIALSEIFFSFLFFNILKKKHLPVIHILGAIFTLSGAMIILAPNFTHFKLGDLLVLLAAMVAPIGNHFMLKAREKVSSENIMFIRSIISTPILFIIGYLLNISLKISNFNSLLFLVINGFLLLGLSKILWLESIKRISVVKAGSLSSISPFFTLIIAWLVLDNIPNYNQLFAIIPMFIGIILLSYTKKKKEILI